jgi:hypothetical protein
VQLIADTVAAILAGILSIATSTYVETGGDRTAGTVVTILFGILSITVHACGDGGWFERELGAMRHIRNFFTIALITVGVEIV